MPDVEIHLEVWCGKCRRGICSNVSMRRTGEIEVEPCSDCMDECYSAGHSDGYSAGHCAGSEVT